MGCATGPPTAQDDANPGPPLSSDRVTFLCGSQSESRYLEEENTLNERDQSTGISQRLRFPYLRIWLVLVIEVSLCI